MRRIGLSTLLLAACTAQAAPVALDVGHFADNPGATSARGRVEFEFNVELARETASALLRRGVQAMLVGADGRMQHLYERTNAARGAAVLLSVHHDSVQPQFLQTWDHEGQQRLFSDRYAGFSLFVSRRNREPKRSLSCASSLGAALRAAGFTPSLYHADAVKGEMKPFADRVNGVHYYDNLAVLRHAAQPAVLFEAGVIVNREEELALRDSGRRARMADALAEALARCLQL